MLSGSQTLMCMNWVRLYTQNRICCALWQMFEALWLYETLALCTASIFYPKCSSHLYSCPKAKERERERERWGEWDPQQRQSLCCKGSVSCSLVSSFLLFAFDPHSPCLQATRHLVAIGLGNKLLGYSSIWDTYTFFFLSVALYGSKFMEASMASSWPALHKY